MTRSATPEQREHAIALAAEQGVREAAKQTGWSKASISSWAKQAGVRTVQPEKGAAARQAAALRWEQRRADEADACGRDAEIVRQKMLAYVDADQSLEANRLVAVFGVLIDKAQLLTGGATERHDHREQTGGMLDELARRRAEKEAAA